jgi:hypothetical protein
VPRPAAATAQSPLGGWQLPAVVQVTTAGTGKLLAAPVRAAAAAGQLRQLQQARAAAVAVQGDSR